MFPICASRLWIQHCRECVLITRTKHGHKTQRWRQRNKWSECASPQLRYMTNTTRSHGRDNPEKIARAGFRRVSLFRPSFSIAETSFLSGFPLCIPHQESVPRPTVTILPAYQSRSCNNDLILKMLIGVERLGELSERFTWPCANHGNTRK